MLDPFSWGVLAVCGMIAINVAVAVVIEKWHIKKKRRESELQVATKGGGSEGESNNDNRDVKRTRGNSLDSTNRLTQSPDANKSYGTTENSSGNTGGTKHKRSYSTTNIKTASSLNIVNGNACHSKYGAVGNSTSMADSKTENVSTRIDKNPGNMISYTTDNWSPRISHDSNERLDKTSSGSDKTSTSSDKTSTGSDKTSSGSDKTSTGTDKTSSGFDKTSSCSDKTCSGSDKTSSGSDKTYSGSDKTSSGSEKTSSGKAGNSKKSVDQIVETISSEASPTKSKSSDIKDSQNADPQNTETKDEQNTNTKDKQIADTKDEQKTNTKAKQNADTKDKQISDTKDKQKTNTKAKQNADTKDKQIADTQDKQKTNTKAKQNADTKDKQIADTKDKQKTNTMTQNTENTSLPNPNTQQFTSTFSWTSKRQ